MQAERVLFERFWSTRNAECSAEECEMHETKEDIHSKVYHLLLN
jgi:hypothetical protein